MKGLRKHHKSLLGIVLVFTIGFFVANSVFADDYYIPDVTYPDTHLPEYPYYDNNDFVEFYPPYYTYEHYYPETYIQENVFKVQLGAFRYYNNALTLARVINDTLSESVTIMRNSTYFIVVTSNTYYRSDARAVAKYFARNGYKAYVRRWYAPASLHYYSAPYGY